MEEQRHKKSNYEPLEKLWIWKEAYETINHMKKFEVKRVWPQNICSNLTGRYIKLIFGINKYIKYVNEAKEKFDSK